MIYIFTHTRMCGRATPPGAHRVHTGRGLAPTRHTASPGMWHLTTANIAASQYNKTCQGAVEASRIPASEGPLRAQEPQLTNHLLLLVRNPHGGTWPRIYGIFNIPQHTA